MDTQSINNKHNLLNSLVMHPKDNARLWKKFQLEWNYHSNSIEGNTLTYGETELLLVHGQTTGTHDFREYEEMKAHDLAINHLRSIADDDRNITEIDIRDLNKILLKEPFFKDAITQSGAPTRKQIIPGEYKTTPNNVRLANGDLFEFCPPSDVPFKIRELILWLDENLFSKELHPIEIASIIHHKFVLIHPFDDGNGRTARLLVNYILLKNNYPPVIVRTELKQSYLAALRLADAGDIHALTDFLVTSLEWSLNTAIKAAKGKDISESGDMEKEIAIFVRNQQQEIDPHRTTFDEYNCTQLIDQSIIPLLEKIEISIQSFKPLFTEIKLRADYIGANVKEIKSSFESLQIPLPDHFHFFIELLDYRSETASPFNVEKQLAITINFTNFIITFDSITIHESKGTENISPHKIDELVNLVTKSIFTEIKEKTSN